MTTGVGIHGTGNPLFNGMNISHGFIGFSGGSLPMMTLWKRCGRKVAKELNSLQANLEDD